MSPSTLAAVAHASERKQDWRLVLVLFCVTSVVEAYCISQTIAFLLPYLLHMGLNEHDARGWVGVLSSLTFVVGLPLVPLWGVWADKYSRKAVIIRTALVEVVVFSLVGLSTTPLQLAGSMLLSGLQIGNTGVMLAALRDLAPTNRLGLAISIFGAMGSLGLAIGPVIGGVLLDGLHLTYSQNYFVAAGLSLFIALLLTFAFREVRPSHVPQGRALSLAYGAIKNVLSVPSTRRIFSAFGLAFFGFQAIWTYLPALVLQIYGSGQGKDSAIGWVAGGASMLGAVLSPFGGVVGDRFGYRPVLVVACTVAACTLAVMPFTGLLPLLFVASVIFGACTSVFTAMVFSLLAMETPEEYRSSTLNLVFLPLYVAGIVGPIVAGLVIRYADTATRTAQNPNGLGLTVVFLLAAGLSALALRPLLSRQPRSEERAENSTTDSRPALTPDR